MRVRIAVAGPASPEVVWDRYADPQAWAKWAPQIRGVETEGRVSTRLHPGLRGTVTAALGVPVRFVVIEVDAAAGAWSWVVRPPGVRMVLQHTVQPTDDGGTRAGLVIEGRAPVVLVYRAVAGVALRRLVSP